jgi:ribosome-associated heat shock protein Hsp15
LAGPSGKTATPATPTLRLDKWLWQARFVKSRSLAAALIEGGAVRVNGTRVTRPGRDVVAGDVLTLPLGDRIRVVRILALGQRRGPAPEAQLLYADLDSGDAASHLLE